MAIIGNAETRIEGRSETESKTTQTSQPPDESGAKPTNETPAESETRETDTPSNEASEVNKLPPTSTSAVDASEKSATTRASKTFPNGDVMTSNINGLVNYVTYLAGRGIRDTSEGNYIGAFQTAGVAGVAPVNTYMSARFKDQLSRKSVNLDYNATSASVTISIYTRTVILSKTGNSNFHYYTDWRPKSSGDLQMKTPGVKGTYTFSSVTGSGALKKFNYTFTFTQTGDLKGNKIDFTFSPEMDLLIDEYYMDAPSSVKQRNNIYKFKDISLSITRTGTDVVGKVIPQTVTYGRTNMLASTVGNTLASAEVIDNGNGTLTIDNSNGTSDSSASVKVLGQVGFDNTNPKSPDPKDPNTWLNIDIPTKMVFASTEASGFKDIEGDAGKLVNRSGRPVEVSVADYVAVSGGVADTKGIASLTLTGGVTTPSFDLRNFKSGILTVLDSPQAAGQNAPIAGKSEVKLSLSGKVDPSLKKVHMLNNQIELKFKALDKDGKPLNP
ncbi:MAG: hypothetical protein WAZ33_07230 [Lactococcus raffinolactis]|nr:hypothetical protein [Lactococcus sp.]